MFLKEPKSTASSLFWGRRAVQDLRIWQKNIPKFCVQTSLDKKIFSEIGIIIALPHRNTGSLLRKLTENLQSVTKIQRALQCGIFQTNLTASAIVSYAKKLSENGLRCDMTIILTSLILHIGTLSGATHIRRGTK